MKAVVVMGLLIAVAIVARVEAAVEPRELNALRDFYNTTNGRAWTYSTNWLTGDPCDNKWYGIKCVNGHVDALDFILNNLIGELPSSIGNLTYVTQVNLDCFNKIGGRLPDSISLMTKVFVWTMASDPLVGPLPVPGFCTMKNSLQILHLGGAKFTGQIPECLSFMATRNCGLESIAWKCPIPDWARTGCHATCV